jgi:ParB-like chromosome segregation protein Spo0J
MANPTVARVGTARAGVVEVPLDGLTPLHPVPRPGKPPTYIADLADSIKNNGYRLQEAIPVFRMSDGRLIIAGGHHRVAAMRLLGEATIPARVIDWDSLAPGVQDVYRANFPGVF